MALTVDGISYDSKSFTPSETTVAEAVVSQDGLTLFVLSLSSDTIRQYTLSTAFDISTASDTGKTFSTLAFNTNVTGLYLSPNGMNIYVYNYTNSRLHQINLSSANDLTGASSPGYVFISSTVMFSPRRGLWFSHDGFYVFLASYYSGGTHVVRLSLSSAWDVSTVNVSTVYADNPYRVYFVSNGYATGLMFTNNGATMLLAYDGSDLVKEYALSTPYDPASAIDTGLSYDLATVCGTSLKGVSLNDPGGKLYAYGATQSFYQFSMGAPAETVPAVVGDYVVASLFELVITGAADSTTDATLPMVTFNARLRSGSPSYLQATIPYTTEHAQAISDRPNGDLYLYQVDLYRSGAEVTSEVTNVALETIQISRGATEKSIVLTGHRQSTNTDVASHDIRSLSVQSGTTTTVIAPGFNASIRPADTVVADGLNLVVDTVSIQVSVGNVMTQYIGETA